MQSSSSDQAGADEVPADVWVTRTDELYKDKKELGSGTYGVVSLAYKSEDHARYLRGEVVPMFAVKRFLYSDSVDATREVRALQRVRAKDGSCDPSVVCYVSHFIDAKLRFTIVTNFADGKTLLQITEEAERSGQTPGSQLSAELMQRLVRSLLEGLHYMHRKNVVHRDIKGSNIMVINYRSASMSAVYLDLGLACVDNQDCRQQTLSILEYSSPEQLAARVAGRAAELTMPEFKASDVWFLANAIHHFGSGGRFPFQTEYMKRGSELRKRAAGRIAAKELAQIQAELAALDRDISVAAPYIVRQLKTVQEATFSRGTNDDGAASTSAYMNLSAAKLPTSDSLSLRIIAEMFHFDWRRRLLPQVGIMLLERAEIDRLEFSEPAIVSFDAPDLAKLPTKYTRKMQSQTTDGLPLPTVVE